MVTPIIKTCCRYARTLHIHLVSERTGLAHPWASKPIIDVHFHEDLGTTLCVVDVHGCFLSVLFAGDDAAPPSHKNHMRVYNWKLGILVKVRLLDLHRTVRQISLYHPDVGQPSYGKFRDVG